MNQPGTEKLTAKKKTGAICTGLGAPLLQQFLLFVFSFIAGVLSVSFGITDINGSEMRLLSTTAFILASGAAMVLFVVFTRRRKRPVGDVFLLRKIPLRCVLPYIVMGGAISFGVGAMMELLPLPESMRATYEAAANTMDTGWVGFIAIVVFAPVCEEIALRGIMLNQFRKVMPAWLAVALQAVVFGLIHGNWYQGIAMVAMGLVLGAVTVRANSIIPAIIMHVVNNSLAFAGGNAPLPAWLLLLICLVVCAGAMAVAARLTRRAKAATGT